MNLVAFRCAWCLERAEKPSSAVNRARRKGMRLFCDRKCFGRANRKHKTRAQKVAEKRAYDMGYRRKHHATRKVQKAEYHKRTYDPVAAAKVRKKRMPYHVEYCRQPEYRAKKHQYDKRRYHVGTYGPWAEVSMLAHDLNREIKRRMTNEQIKRENGTWGKRQARALAEGDEARRHRNRAA